MKNSGNETKQKPFRLHSHMYVYSFITNYIHSLVTFNCYPPTLQDKCQHTRYGTNNHFPDRTREAIDPTCERKTGRRSAFNGSW